MNKINKYEYSCYSSLSCRFGMKSEKRWFSVTLIANIMKLIA